MTRPLVLRLLSPASNGHTSRSTALVIVNYKMTDISMYYCYRLFARGVIWVNTRSCVGAYTRVGVHEREAWTGHGSTYRENERDMDKDRDNY